MIDLKKKLLITNTKDSILENLICEELSNSLNVEKLLINELEEAEISFSKVVAQLTRLDTVIIIASHVSLKIPIGDEDFFEDFHHTIEKNLLAITQFAQLSIPHIIETNGRIIIVSSSHEESPQTETFDSISVVNTGLSMLTKTIANALEGTDSRVAFLKISSNCSDEQKTKDSFQGLTKFISFVISNEASYVHGSTISFS